MEHTERNWMRFHAQPKDEPEAQAGATARFGGDAGDEPVLVAVLEQPVAGDMAQAALEEAGIPAFVKRNVIGALYGLSVSPFGRSEVWVHPQFVPQARDILLGMGVLDEPEPDDAATD